jgi:hypothetical protein
MATKRASKPKAKTKAKAKAKPKRAKRVRLDPAERERKLELARSSAVEYKRRAGELSSRLSDAMDLARDLAAQIWTTRLTMAKAKSSRPDSWSTPWAIVARFDFPVRADGEGIGYADLHRILRAWRASKRLGKLIGMDRLSRIQVSYITGRGKKPLQYTLGETLAWEYVLSRAITRVDPNSDDDRPGENLAVAYSDTRVSQMFVWLSVQVQHEIKGRLTLRRHT